MGGEKIPGAPLSPQFPPPQFGRPSPIPTILMQMSELESSRRGKVQESSVPQRVKSSICSLTLLLSTPSSLFPDLCEPPGPSPLGLLSLSPDFFFLFSLVISLLSPPAPEDTGLGGALGLLRVTLLTCLSHFLPVKQHFHFPSRL